MYAFSHCIFIETSGKIPDREGWSVKLVDEHGQGIVWILGNVDNILKLCAAKEVQKGEMGELWAKNPTLANVSISMT